jgi:uncharacterized protein (DUF4415 family)
MNKRKPGRPRHGLERKTRINIVLSPDVARLLRAMGGGNLSKGIEIAAGQYKMRQVTA